MQGRQSNENHDQDKSDLENPGNEITDANEGQNWCHICCCQKSHYANIYF